MPKRLAKQQRNRQAQQPGQQNQKQEQQARRPGQERYQPRPRSPTRQQQDAPARAQQPQKTPGTCAPRSYAYRAQIAHSHQTRVPTPCSPYAPRHYHEATCQREPPPHNRYHPSRRQREPARVHAQPPHHQQTHPETPTRAPSTRSRLRYRPSSTKVLPAPTIHRSVFRIPTLAGDYATRQVCKQNASTIYTPT